LTYKHFAKLKHSWDTQNKNNNIALIGITEDYFENSQKVRKSGRLANKNLNLLPENGYDLIFSISNFNIDNY
jgi:hypothetical protein